MLVVPSYTISLAEHNYQSLLRKMSLTKITLSTREAGIIVLFRMMEWDETSKYRNTLLGLYQVQSSLCGVPINVARCAMVAVASPLSSSTTEKLLAAPVIVLRKTTWAAFEK
jgi:hypothetical protein